MLGFRKPYGYKKKKVGTWAFREKETKKQKQINDERRRDGS